MHPRDSHSGNFAAADGKPTTERIKSSTAMLLSVVSLIVIAVLVSKAAIVSTKPDTRHQGPGSNAASATAPAANVAEAPLAAPAATVAETPSAESSANTSRDFSNAKITAPSFATTRKAAKVVPTIYGVATPRDVPTAPGVVLTAGARSTSIDPVGVQPKLFASPAATGIIPVAPGRQPGLSWQSLRSIPGVLFEVEAITDASTGTSVMNGAQALRTHESFAVTLDMDSLVGWPGLSFYAQHRNKVGGNGSGNAALLQSFSNIDAVNFSAWGEIFAEQRVFQDRLRIKAGRLDFNSDFAGTDNGGDFLNASMGFSPSITAAPTYPLPTTGAVAFYAPNSTFEIGGGAFNGVNGAPAKEGGTSRFLITQANAHWSLGGGRAGRTGVGVFKHTGVFSSALPESDDAPSEIIGTNGWYATLDQTLWSAPTSADGESTRSVAAFFQVGRSNPRVAGVRAHSGGGVTLTGVLPHLSSGVIGFGATSANSSDGREVISELFYKTPVFSRLSVVMDAQRVHQTDGAQSRRVGNLVTLRTIVTF